jgi:uncharacterized damage-inducible protein DinB
MSNAVQIFLETFDREHATTLRVLRAYPPDQLDLKPSPKSSSARELASVFMRERNLAMRIWRDEFAKGFTPGTPAPAPETLDEILTALEKANSEFRAIVAAATDEDLHGKVSFFTAPKTMGQMTRSDMIWFILHDEIHHRGQLSVYLRIAGGKVPSIYGPSADEPWT